LFYDRANPRFGLSSGIFLSNQKQLLKNGFQDRQTEDYNLKARFNLNRIYNVKLEYATNFKTSESDFLEDRNYKIRTYRLAPSISWQPTNSLRVSTSYVFKDRRNILSADINETSSFNEFIIELRTSKATKNNFSARFRFAKIEFTGDEQSPVGYELLEALRPGNNGTWTATYQRKIIAGLQLNIIYEGRKSPQVDLIHTGRVQVSALF